MHRQWLLALLISVGALRFERDPFAAQRDVNHVLLDVRVLDEAGRSVTGLRLDDFDVRIAGRRAAIDSVEWIGPASPTTDADGPGRTIVFLVQKTLQSSPLSFQGRQTAALQKTLQVIDPLLLLLRPSDRVAVLSLDAELRLRCDLTADLHALRRLLQKDILTTTQGCVSRPQPPLLADSLSAARMRDVHSAEEALDEIGNALAAIPGPKTLLFVGFGFGKPDALNRSLESAAQLPGIIDQGDYEKGRRSLVAARTAAFSLDVTDADHHALETGFQAIAAETGGLFVRTHQFPDVAIRQIANALVGHYVISVETPDVARGSHRLEVRLVRQRGRVLSPSRYHF
jgi:VWFA-related protein